MGKVGVNPCSAVQERDAGKVESQRHEHKMLDDSSLVQALKMHNILNVRGERQRKVSIAMAVTLGYGRGVIKANRPIATTVIV